MNRVVDALTTINEAALTLLTGVQDRTLEANKSLASLVKTPATSIPSWPGLPDFESAQEIVKQGYEWVGKVLEADQKFTLELLELWSPSAKAAN